MLPELPVKVMIESDDLTEVVVYKVGKLGKFNLSRIIAKTRYVYSGRLTQRDTRMSG